MSMLAERQWKEKWAVDPQNTAWSNDDSKFGQRMLEKMGWSKGKGLGAQEQGATDHIKVQVKNNHLGLGATINNEDNWIVHQDDFNQLLAELNTCRGQETADPSDKKEKKSFSLEENSKISKNHVHYMKFTKGKDLSSRSKTDLDCIFGKRQSRKTLEGDDSSSTPDENESTTTGAFTIQEYFAQRKAALKNKPQVPDPGLTFPRQTKRQQVRMPRGIRRKIPRGTGPRSRGPRRVRGSSSEASAQDPKKRRGRKKLRKPVEIAEEATPVKRKKKKDFK
uniref:G-patch domain-containing protein n=1 Tax=Cebus imitator TaxID=2715852 RepID=A0A2K5S239_CEBIM